MMFVLSAGLLTITSLVSPEGWMDQIIGETIPLPHTESHLDTEQDHQIFQYNYKAPVTLGDFHYGSSCYQRCIKSQDLWKTPACCSQSSREDNLRWARSLCSDCEKCN